LTGRTLSLPGLKFGDIAGLALIILGAAMVGIAAVRFVRTTKNIDRTDQRPGTGSRIDIALAALPVLLGCALSTKEANESVQTGESGGYTIQGMATSPKISAYRMRREELALGP
jgi:hypothetical protein